MLLIRHVEVLAPFGLSLSKPIHLSISSARTDFKLHLAESIRRFFLIFCLVAIPAVASASEDIVVIVNQKSGVDKMSREEVINIFLGRNRHLTSGVTALPLDLPSTLLEREQFYLRLTGKGISEINAYWARLIFSGRASPPALVHSQDEAMQMVINNSSAVGYVARSKVAPSVKIVFALDSK